ncbi:hypothetical protein ACOQFO_02755 [Ureibacillus sp. MALMAid1270]|uniref:hypothetical protein n=1 Tax=Ureibacillus sp. MALMAid1270 TaxID=3411629 RepID=UPI003BA4ED1F
MSEYMEFQAEKRKIDSYFEDGYEISIITEDLSGMHIEFASPFTADREKVKLLLTTPEARKYIATRLLYPQVMY